MRWEVSGRTTAVLLDIAARIYSKQHATSLCCSHLAFSPSVSLRVDSGTMAMEGYSTFLKALALLEPHHQIV